LFAHVLLEHELLVGETVIRELRSKLRIKLKLPKNAIDEIEALLRDQTGVVGPLTRTSVYGVAVAGMARYSPPRSIPVQAVSGPGGALWEWRLPDPPGDRFHREAARVRCTECT
jgi:hypothetical protein